MNFKHTKDLILDLKVVSILLKNKTGPANILFKLNVNEK